MSAKIPRAGFLTVPGSSVSASQIIETPCLVVRKQTFTNPSVADVDGVIATPIAGPNATTSTILPASMDGATAPLGVIPESCGRNITVLVTHSSSIVALSGVITGYDMYGNIITETWSVTATGTSKTYTGAKAFKRLISITVIGATDASADSVSAGYGLCMGLDRICATAKFVAEECDSANPTAGTIVKGVAAHATADARGTYTPNTAANGAHDYDVWYIVENVEKITQ